jgi:hypothetical protein
MQRPMMNANGRGERGRQNTDPLVRGLGWLSLGLGAAGLVRPRELGRSVGVGKNESLLRFFGARETVCGVGILTQPTPAPWLWARVLGDVMDLSVLTMSAVSRGGAARRRALGATAGVAALTPLDVIAAVRTSKHGAKIGAQEAAVTQRDDNAS